MKLMSIFLLTLAKYVFNVRAETCSASMLSDWNEASNMECKLQVLSTVQDGWIITLSFSKPISSLEVWIVDIATQSSDGRIFELHNKDWNKDLETCEILELSFIAHKAVNGESAAIALANLTRKSGNDNLGDTDACGSTPTDQPPSTAQVTNGAIDISTTASNQGTISPSPFDYDEVLHKSILFYEAQRSGKLPENNRISWRKDSALGDSGDNGEDLTGGWYDAGDYVKFGFPMASSVTVLAWGLVEYRDAYQAAGELDAMLDCIKWPLDYFIKAHPSKFLFYGQVGDGGLDHDYWGRPEDMTMSRPAFKITTSKPGSELAAETAAAMAAASIAFNQTDPSYASTLLQHAEDLYEFADTYRGKYSDSISNAAEYYTSYSGYNDELVWAAAWLYRATNKAEYLTKAEQYYQQFGMNSLSWGFSWDEKIAGAQLLLAKITEKVNYKQDIQTYVDSWLPGGSVQYTPKGLAWRAKWGSNRYAANTAFLALVAADHGIKADAYREFAKKQVNYILGDSGRSYVVGFGNNPPERPHHASSSCPLAPAACTWDQFNSAGPNPHVLNGALVGGPGESDNYADVRTDYIKNEVTTDYNAGFQSAVAALRHLHSSYQPLTTPISTQPAQQTKSDSPTDQINTQNSPTTLVISPSPYDYDEVLHKSILFYEAQRSGKLPENNRISWRKDSALGDNGDNGEDLTGGWYDAGDYVKFGFPMASSVTVLAWGLVEYRDAYQAAGELDAMLDCIKWPLDYFIKAHPSKFLFYGQVGDGGLDHAYWGRPEDMTMSRPAFKITTSKPGSELAAETAAAMAAASIAFNQTDPSYASTLLQHAEDLYEFADTYRGKYSDSISNAAEYYTSYSGYNDELVWAAAWLHRATNKAEYLTKAEQYYQQFGMNSLSWGFSWDEKIAGAQLLLAKITDKVNYKQDIQTYVDSWLPGGSVQYTPKGLAWRAKWGSNRYAANTAFLALVAADHGIKADAYREFAKKQVNYILGDSGHSYVVGFGNNPPERPHHASSSCPLPPAACTWDQFNSAGPNPHVLNGALVGGPGENDNYADVRTDYIKNEVTTDYNAGFQSAVAGLRTLYPPSPTESPSGTEREKAHFSLVLSLVLITLNC